MVFKLSYGQKNSSSKLQMCIWIASTYRKIFYIKHTSVGNKIVDHSDVVGATPIGAAPTTSSFAA